MLSRCHLQRRASPSLRAPVEAHKPSYLGFGDILDEQNVPQKRFEEWMLNVLGECERNSSDCGPQKEHRPSWENAVIFEMSERKVEHKNAGII